MFAPFVQIILVAWIPMAIALFYFWPTKRALIFGVLASTMFLPMAVVEIPMIPGEKAVFISVGLLIAALVTNPWPILAVRPKWVDIPMLLVCVLPGVSALSNERSYYDTTADMLAAFCLLGSPYLLGRAYLTDLRALWQITYGMFI